MNFWARSVFSPHFGAHHPHHESFRPPGGVGASQAAEQIAVALLQGKQAVYRRPELPAYVPVV